MDTSAPGKSTGLIQLLPFLVLMGVSVATLVRQSSIVIVYNSYLDSKLDLPTNNSKTQTSTATTTTTTRPIPESSSQQLESLAAWRLQRNNNRTMYNHWFVDQNGQGVVKNNADANGTGAVLDFLIAGFAKCGTTGMMRTLAEHAAAMPPNRDVCTPIDQVVYYCYNKFVRQYGRDKTTGGKKPLRGSKCPHYVEHSNGYLREISTRLPKTKLIVGIRHPVLWFQSFTNMRSVSVFRQPNETRKVAYLYRKVLLSGQTSYCRRKVDLYCVARARFQLPLARLGKTPLDEEEQDLLRSELIQSQRRIEQKDDPAAAAAAANTTKADNNNKINYKSIWEVPIEKRKPIPNHVFLFETTQGKEEYLYDELADFVGIDRSYMPPLNVTFRSGIRRPHSVDLCDPAYDGIRKELMPISYSLSEWLLKYLVPASLVREDLVIPTNKNKNNDNNNDGKDFVSIVKGYAEDPCKGPNRLIRNAVDGEYYN